MEDILRYVDHDADETRRKLEGGMKKEEVNFTCRDTGTRGCRAGGRRWQGTVPSEKTKSADDENETTVSK